MGLSRSFLYCPVWGVDGKAPNLLFTIDARKHNQHNNSLGHYPTNSNPFSTPQNIQLSKLDAVEFNPVFNTWTIFITMSNEFDLFNASDDIFDLISRMAMKI